MKVATAIIMSFLVLAGVLAFAAYRSNDLHRRGENRIHQLEKARAVHAARMNDAGLP